MESPGRYRAGLKTRLAFETWPKGPDRVVTLGDPGAALPGWSKTQGRLLGPMRLEFWSGATAFGNARLELRTAVLQSVAEANNCLLDQGAQAEMPPTRRDLSRLPIGDVCLEWPARLVFRRHNVVVGVAVRLDDDTQNRDTEKRDTICERVAKAMDLHLQQQR